MPTVPFLGSYGDISGSGIGFRNRIINGDCRITQRGAVAATNNTVLYGGADRMLTVPIGFTTVTAGSIQRSALNGSNSNFGHWLTGLTTTGSGNVVIGQRIEDVFVYDMNSQTVTFSGLLYHDVGSTLSVSVEIRKAGALNSFSTSTLVGSSTVSAASGVITPFTCTTSLGSTDATNGIACQVNFPISTSLTSKNFAVSNLQFERGSYASSFESRYYWDEINLARRYYQKLNGGLCFNKPGTNNELMITNSNPVWARSGTWTLTLSDANFTAGSPTGNQWTVYTPGISFGTKSGTVSFVGDGGSLFVSSGATFTNFAQWTSSGTSGLVLNAELT